MINYCVFAFTFLGLQKMSEPRVSEVSENVHGQDNHWDAASLSGPHGGRDTFTFIT